jgi:SAM-dependent methyltransferase
MRVVARVYEQFRKPVGVLGWLAGTIMARRASNVQRSRWTVEQLDLRQTDHVLEIGFGPGLAIAHVAQLAPHGRVVGIDHSALMVRNATRRNRDAIRSGLVELKMGGFDLLPRVGETFDKVFSVNVMMFVEDRVQALRAIRSVLRPDGIVATTFQPRHLGAKVEDAQVFGEKVSAEMREVGFGDISMKVLDLKPLPAICVLGRR